MRYLLAGGGTAGHVNPLLALAEHIKQEQPASEIYVLGTAEGLEARLVPERGFELLTIARLPFPRKPSMYALRFGKLFFAAVRQVQEIIAQKNISVVVGFGGYAAAPAYVAAKRAGVPYVIHEANAKPGLANVFGAKNAAAVGVTFAGTPIKDAEVTGMPLRREITALADPAKLATARAEARDFFGLNPELKTLLITGGSLGARALNEAFKGAADLFSANGIQVLHLWGGLTKMQEVPAANYQVLEYCDRMELAFAAADFVVSRAGSTAVSEVAGLGIPAVFVPYETGNGEQRKNARSVVEAGGALLVPDKELTREWIHTQLIPLILDSERLEKMHQNSLKVGDLQGTQNLNELVKKVTPGA